MQKKKIHHKHLVALFSLCMMVFVLFTGCMNKGVVSPDEGQSTGTVAVAIKLGKVGTLAKQKKIELKKLIITITEKDGDSIFFTDTSELSESGEVLFKQNVPGLPAPEDYTLTAKSIDKNNEVIHSGKKEFTTIPADTVDVPLNLDAKYSMLNVGFADLPDSVTSVQLLIAGVDTLDSSFTAGSLENVILSYDYLEASDSGKEYKLSLNASGKFFGFDSVLFAADTTILARSGLDSNYTIALKWLGPTVIEGHPEITVVVGSIGTNNVCGLFQDVYTIPTDGLVAYYPFNGNADDESGNGNDGTVYGATLIKDRFESSEKAYSFNGVDNYIKIDGVSKIDNMSEYTISAWIFSAESHWLLSGYGYYGTIVAKASSSPTPNGSGWSLYVTKPTDKTKNVIESTVNYSLGAARQLNAKISYAVSKQLIVPGKWHFTTATYHSNSQQVNVYINGNTVVYYFKQPGLGVSDDAAISLQIGKQGPSNDPNPSWFNGIIDDVRIYNRALSEKEIKALYYENGWTGEE